MLTIKRISVTVGLVGLSCWFPTPVVTCFHVGEVGRRSTARSGAAAPESKIRIDRTAGSLNARGVEPELVRAPPPRNTKHRVSLQFASLLVSAAIAMAAFPTTSFAVSGGGLDYANIDITGQDFSKGNYKGKDFTQGTENGPGANFWGTSEQDGKACIRCQKSHCTNY